LLIRANLKNTILLYFIAGFINYLPRLPYFIIANVQLYTLYIQQPIIISLPYWAEILILIATPIAYLFKVSLIMGFYLKAINLKKL
jgi:hypothetical protein